MYGDVFIYCLVYGKSIRPRAMSDWVSEAAKKVSKLINENGFNIKKVRKDRNKRKAVYFDKSINLAFKEVWRILNIIVINTTPKIKSELIFIDNETPKRIPTIAILFIVNFSFNLIQ